MIGLEFWRKRFYGKVVVNGETTLLASSRQPARKQRRKPQPNEFVGSALHTGGVPSR
jgi:hypothetical protein